MGAYSSGYNWCAGRSLFGTVAHAAHITAPPGTHERCATARDCDEFNATCAHATSIGIRTRVRHQHSWIANMHHCNNTHMCACRHVARLFGIRSWSISRVGCYEPCIEHDVAPEMLNDQQLRANMEQEKQRGRDSRWEAAAKCTWWQDGASRAVEAQEHKLASSCALLIGARGYTPCGLWSMHVGSTRWCAYFE